MGNNNILTQPQIQTKLNTLQRSIKKTDKVKDVLLNINSFCVQLMDQASKEEERLWKEQIETKKEGK